MRNRHLPRRKWRFLRAYKKKKGGGGTGLFWLGSRCGVAGRGGGGGGGPPKVAVLTVVQESDAWSAHRTFGLSDQLSVRSERGGRAARPDASLPAFASTCPALHAPWYRSVFAPCRGPHPPHLTKTAGNGNSGSQPDRGLEPNKLPNRAPLALFCPPDCRARRTQIPDCCCISGCYDA